MNEKTLIGYHGTSKEASESILKNGFKISKSKNKKYEWLGDGVYFWEDDYYAVQWNIINIEKDNKDKNIEVLEDYEIIKSKLKVNKLKLFELSSPEGSIIYKELKEKLSNRFVEEGYKNYIEKLSKQSDKFWINLLEDNGFFKEFDIITATYKNEKNKERYKDDIVLNVQKQICVKNINCIITSELYKDKERILDLFSKIIERRRLIKNEEDKETVEKS